MKKIILAAFMLTSVASFAQLRKVDTSKMEKAVTIGKAQQFGAPLEAEITKLGNVYTIRFRDAEFKTLDQYREFSFEDVDNTFNDLYAAIEEGFKTMPKESVMLDIPKYYVWLNYDKMMGFPGLRFSYKEKDTDKIYYSNQITKKQIEKLFAKR